MDTTLEKSQSGNEQFAPQLRQVHTITDRFAIANTYLILDEGMIIVDPDSELNARLTVEYIRRFLHRSLSEVDLVVLTHLHREHTAGIEALHRECQAPVAAYAVARKIAEAEAQGKHLPGITHRAGHPLPGAFHHLDILPPPYYASQTKMVDIWLNDVEGLPGHPNWRVIGSAGHTLESLCLYNPFTYELLCGDTATTFQAGSPFVRLGTSRRKLEETLRTLPVHYLYPGHGRSILSKHPLENMPVEW